MRYRLPIVAVLCLSLVGATAWAATDISGTPIVTFNGTIESPTRMTGTVEVPYCPEGQRCTWTATRSATKKK